MQYKQTEEQTKRAINLINRIMENHKDDILMDEEMEYTAHTITDKDKFESFLFDRVMDYLENSDDVLYVLENAIDAINHYALKDKLIKRI